MVSLQWMVGDSIVAVAVVVVTVDDGGSGGGSAWVMCSMSV